MSWHKASLSSHPVWIGWRIDLTTFTVCMEANKQQRLLDLLLSVLETRHVSRHDVERLTGKLLCLSGLFSFLRPTLAPSWPLRPSLDANLLVTGSIGHPSVPVGSTLVRLARMPISELADIPSRRVWIQVSHRRTSSVLVTGEVREVLSLWQDFLHQTTCRQSILLAPAFHCEAFAEACADSSAVGLGGYVNFPSGLKRFFQLAISRPALALLCPFFPRDGNPQRFIAAWELLAQCALVWTTHTMLPLAHPPLHVVLRCDNSASESAAWKGLSLAKGRCAVLRQFSDLQRRTCISAHMEHVPAFLNDTADSLSRDGDAVDLGFCDDDFRPHISPLEADISQHVPALL